MAEIANLVEETLNNACEAAAVFTQFNQEQVDRIVRAVLEAGLANRVRLAKMAAEETALGRWEDKVAKNLVATLYLYEDIKRLKTVGVISNDPSSGITEIAQPLGPILAVIPVGTTCLMAELAGVGERYPLSSEILAPILAYYEAETFDQAVSLCIDINYHGGMFNTLPVSFTLGCGSGGRNITTDNVTARHLLNIQCICRRRVSERFGRLNDVALDETVGAAELEKLYNRNF